MSTLVWEISLFGPFCARHGELRLSHFRTRKTASLLSYLAYHHQSVHRREEIMEFLWPGRPSEDAHNLLRVTLAHLRKALTIPEAPTLLICEGDTIRLDTTVFMTDKRRFFGLVKEANKADSEDEKLRLLRRAVDLCQGELLPGFDELWVTEERQRWNDMYLVMLRQVIMALATRGALDPAIEYAQRGLKIDPLRQESHRMLMTVYVAAGRAEAALQHYNDLTRMLAEEVNAAPTSLTMQLFTDIQTAYLSPPAPPPARSPSSSSMPASAGKLPTLLSPLFGRANDVEWIQQMLVTPETRLISLTGLGGAGKTRLAIAAGTEARSLFEGEVYFVPLASLTQSEQVADTILATLSLERLTTSPALDQVIAFFASRHALLILDNCEHLLETCVEIIPALLEAAPALVCLVTTRERLRLRYEYEYPVRMLPTPVNTTPPAALMDFAGVQMFAERAQQVQPTFRVDDTNAEAVAALCRWLEGLPLAIELAAAWTSALSPAQILKRLNSRAVDLVSTKRDIPTRHASLYAALEGSYQLLSPNLRTFLAKLSVFRGGMTLEAVESVCETGENGKGAQALDCLMQLGERSLLVTEAAGDTLRYRLLETVRQYAEEKLKALGEAESIALRHASFYQTWAQSQQAALLGAEGAEILRLMDVDVDNIRLALQWCVQAQTPETLQVGALLASAFWRYWSVRGLVQEGLDWFEVLLADIKVVNKNIENSQAENNKTEDKEEAAVKTRALTAAGNLAYRSGRLKLARQYWEACLQIARETQETRRIAGTLSNLGNIMREENQFDSAQESFAQALAIFRELADDRDTGLALSNLASVYSDSGLYERAMHCNQEAYVLMLPFQNRFVLGLMLNNIGNLHIHLRNYDDAAASLAKALAIIEELQDRSLLFQNTFLWALLVIGRKQWKEGVLLFGAADKVRILSQCVISSYVAQEQAEATRLVLKYISMAVFEAYWEKGHCLSEEEVRQYLRTQFASAPCGTRG